MGWKVSGYRLFEVVGVVWGLGCIEGYIDKWCVGFEGVSLVGSY